MKFLLHSKQAKSANIRQAEIVFTITRLSNACSSCSLPKSHSQWLMSFARNETECCLYFPDCITRQWDLLASWNLFVYILFSVITCAIGSQSRSPCNQSLDAEALLTLANLADKRLLKRVASAEKRLPWNSYAIFANNELPRGSGQSGGHWWEWYIDCKDNFFNCKGFNCKGYWGKISITQERSFWRFSTENHPSQQHLVLKIFRHWLHLFSID